MAVGDLYEVRLQGTAFAQENLNIFHYHQALSYLPGTGVDADGLADGFVDQTIPVLAEAMSADMTLESLVVRNLFDESEVVTREFAITGTALTNTTSTSAPFVAGRYILEHGNGAIRQGAKRLGCLPENAQTDGVVDSAAYVTAGDDAADAMLAPILVGLVIQDPVFRPVVIQRVRSGTPGNYTYRLPQTAVEAVYAFVLDVLFDLVIGTQNTRKFGAGS